MDIRTASVTKRPSRMWVGWNHRVVIPKIELENKRPDKVVFTTKRIEREVIARGITEDNSGVVWKWVTPFGDKYVIEYLIPVDRVLVSTTDDGESIYEPVLEEVLDDKYLAIQTLIERVGGVYLEN